VVKAVGRYPEVFSEVWADFNARYVVEDLPINKLTELNSIKGLLRNVEIELYGELEAKVC
jgi:hypothetical protein